ncbi:MAG: hypothetical protein ACJA0Q_001587 [Saprospiraceae bacterium]|jgi:hypothetical protein
MKNALILFAVALPLLILNQLAFKGSSGVLDFIILTIPFIGLNIFLKKTHSQFIKKEVFKKVFKSCLVTGFFYAIWMGTYQFIIMNYIDSEWAQELINQTEQNVKNLFPQEADEALLLSTKLYTSPVYWVFTQIIFNSFFFSIIGLTLGFQFKSKAPQQ